MGPNRALGAAGWCGTCELQCVNMDGRGGDRVAKVLVGMSGGVDSSVAALLLRDAEIGRAHV